MMPSTMLSRIVPPKIPLPLRRALPCLLALGLTLGGVSGWPAPARAAEVLKAQFFLPKVSPLSKRLQEIFAEMEAASGGAIEIRPFFASELVPLPQALEGLREGTLDVLVTAANYYSGKLAIGDFGIMPFNFRTSEDRYRAFYEGGVGKIMDGVYRQIGVTVPAPYLYFIGEELLVRKGVEVASLKDLHGLKVRVAGGELIEMVKALGAQPVFVAPAEMYTALQRGTVDGAIFPAHDLKFLKLSEVVGSVVGPDYLFSGPMMLFILFNQSRWDGFPPELREKLHGVLQRAAERDSRKVMEELTALYRSSAEGSGVRFITLGAPEIARAKDLSQAARQAYLAFNREQGHGPEAEKILAVLDRLQAQ